MAHSTVIQITTFTQFVQFIIDDDDNERFVYLNLDLNENVTTNHII